MTIPYGNDYPEAPWMDRDGEPITDDGAQLLDDLRGTLTRYIVFPDEHASAAVTLWIAATHALPAFECAARLVFTSPQKRCAKSRTLDIIAGTCHRPLPTSDATVAAIFRSIGGNHPPTLIIDEADLLFGSTEIVITPKKLAGLTVLSNELANDSSPAALSVVGEGLVRDLRRKLDAAWLGNTTADGPNGLGSLTTSTATNGGSWATLDSFEVAKSTAESLHTEITAFVTSPATALALSTIKAFSTAGSNMPLLQSDPTQPSARTISGVPLLVSPSVTADTVWAIPRAHTLMVRRQDASVVTDTSVYFTSDRVAVRATLRVSFGFTQPLAIVRITKA